jgi:glycosyltransferase involved in cell wall biosynthesis
MARRRPFGVTIGICTHNGAGRLPNVFQHLSQQSVPPELRWEVLVVDNASTNGPVTIRSDWWKGLTPAPLARVVLEPRLGLSHARERCLHEASFEVISLIDDDNWVDENWVTTAARVLDAYPSTAAVAGRNVVVSETPIPAWFSRFSYLYAVGDLGDEPHDVTESRPQLWGAGLTLRASAWAALYEAGFRSALTDRKGSLLVSGGDSELCLALRRAGWRIRYEPGLRLRHVMNPSRLEWHYFRRLARGSGRATPALDGFHAAYNGPPRFRRVLRRWWVHQALRTLCRGLRHPLRFLLPALFLSEGDPLSDQVEAARGRLHELLRARTAYGARFVELDHCQWRAANPHIAASK